MRYHLDTIPVWDALREDSECLFCLLRRKTEHALTQRYLGASVMEPDTRIRVNQKGFCAQHQKMLYQGQNRLGHALMMLSHVQDLQTRMDSLLSPPPVAKNGLFARAGAKAATPPNEGCALCDTLDENMTRYQQTFLHLWCKDDTFLRELQASKGLCVADTQMLMQFAAGVLKDTALLSLQNQLMALLRDNMARLERELEWFTLKHDYRNEDKPWGTSRDALERTVQKLRGWCVGKDPGLE